MQKKNHSSNDHAAASLTRLLEIMAKLRDKEFGCAWDRKQTLKSLTSHTLEEVYEVIDAVEREDNAQLPDELGDLLFQVVFYAQIAAEQSLFDFTAVADAIVEKLLRRHPHVFPAGELTAYGLVNGASAIDADQVEVNWEAIKDQERALKAFTSNEPAPVSVLDEVPRAFPALDRAKKLQKRAASIGFDWPDTASVMKKLREESDELHQAVAVGDPAKISHELGDLLFTCVNIARHLRLEPETVLREANQRFERRFRYVEQAMLSSDELLQADKLAVMERFWNLAKSEGL
jgi:ATP diphosphatase